MLILHSFGFWCLSLDEGYYAETLPMISPDHIFFHEAFAVVCALHWACHSSVEGLRCIVICLDSTNMVDIFNLLKASGIYNNLLMFAVLLLMQADIDLHIVHISGDLNCIADHLLHFRLDKARLVHPVLQIFHYQPLAVLAEAAL